MITLKKRRLIIRSCILALITVALGYTFYFSFSDDFSLAQTGDASINFVLENLEGERIELDELSGKGVFLNFWGTFCKECVEEMPIMDELYQEYKDKDVELIAINVDESELAVKRFIERLDVSFPVVIDKGLNVTKAYGINPLPTTVLIDKSGI